MEQWPECMRNFSLSRRESRLTWPPVCAEAVRSETAHVAGEQQDWVTECGVTPFNRRQTRWTHQDSGLWRKHRSRSMQQILCFNCLCLHLFILWNLENWNLKKNILNLSENWSHSSLKLFINDLTCRYLTSQHKKGQIQVKANFLLN